MPDIEKETLGKNTKEEQPTVSEELENSEEEKSAPVFEGSFVNDEEKMRDFDELSKEEFLSSYSYLTEAEYEATVLDVKLFALNTNLAVLNENAELNIESGCKAFNEMAAEDDTLLENVDFYNWDKTKSLKENLTECILNGETTFLYDWIDSLEENPSPFIEGVHLQLTDLEASIVAHKEQTKEQAQQTPELYTKTFNEAQSLNEVDKFRDSLTLNVACSLAIQAGMSMMKEQFNAIGLLDKVVSEYGLDRVSAVVASEIKHRMSEMPLNTNNLMNWAQGVVDKLPMQLVNELSLNIDKEQLIDFAYTVMKAEIARDNVQENDTMAELFAQLQKNQHITDNALNPEILNDRRAVEEIKLQSSLAHAKAAFEQQSNTLPILKGLSEIQINKLNNLNAKQTELNNKNKFLVNKGQRLEARAEKLENTSTMLKALFPNRPLPKPLQALANMTAKKAAVIRDEKIPKNNQKIDKNLRKMAKNDRKIEVAQCKVDKYQNMSKVIKSFTILDSAERKQQFTQGLDGLHNASQRSLQLKLEKCEAKIDKLTQKYMDIETPNKPDIMAKLKAQTEKKNTLTEKIEKLGKLEKPFAEQPENVVDDVMKTAETEIAAQEETPERMSMEDFADELCAACVDTVTEPPVQTKDKSVEKVSEKSDKKPSILGDIKDIKAEQSKEHKNVPEQGQKKARSNEAEI